MRRLGRCRLLTRPRLLQSPQTNIVEALLFSAKLRINGDIDRETLEAYVDEVMDLVELSAIRGVIASPCSSALPIPVPLLPLPSIAKTFSAICIASS